MGLRAPQQGQPPSELVLEALGEKVFLPLAELKPIGTSKGCSFLRLITNHLPLWPDKALSDLGLFPKPNLPSKEAGGWSPLKKFRE